VVTAWSHYHPPRTSEEGRGAGGGLSVNYQVSEAQRKDVNEL
jgi:hypothetical protein